MNPNNKKLLKNVVVGAGALGLSGFLANSAWAISSESGEINQLVISPEANQELDANGEEPVGVIETAPPSTESVASVYTTLPVAENTHESQTFAEAFAAARAEVGAGGLFEWNGHHYGTYYKEEWDALPEEAKNEFTHSVFADNSQTEVVDTHLPTDMIITDDHSFADAFATARAELGAGHTFEWNGQIYNTYYENEWNELGNEEQQAFAHTNHLEEVLVADSDSGVNNIIDTEEESGELITATEEHHTHFQPDANANVVMDDDSDEILIVDTQEDHTHFQPDASANVVVEEGEDELMVTGDETHELHIDEHANAIEILEDESSFDEMIADIF